MKAPGVLLCLGLALAASGCLAEIVDPVYEIEGQRLLVVPLGEGYLSYFETPKGVEIARAVGQRLEQEYGEDLEVGDLERVREVLLVGDGEEPDWDDVGRRAGANLVLYGEISEWEVTTPGDVGLLRGHAQASMHLHLVGHSRPVWSGKVHAEYPKQNRYADEGLPATAGEGAIEAGLRRDMAAKIARLFFAHEAD